MNIAQFLNLMIEKINNIDENIVKTIVEIYNYDKRAYEINEKNILNFYIKTNKVIQLLKRL